MKVIVEPSPNMWFQHVRNYFEGVDSLKEERKLFWVGYNVFENYFEVTPNYKHLCHAPKKKLCMFSAAPLRAQA